MADPLRSPATGINKTLPSFSCSSQMAPPQFPTNTDCNFGILQLCGFPDTCYFPFISPTQRPQWHTGLVAIADLSSPTCFFFNLWRYLSPSFVVNVFLEFCFCFYVGLWEESYLCRVSLPSSYQNSPRAIIFINEETEPQGGDLPKITQLVTEDKCLWEHLLSCLAQRRCLMYTTPSLSPLHLPLCFHLSVSLQDSVTDN